LARHRQRAPLPADDVVAEIDLDVEPEGVVGAQLREGLALRRADGFHDLEIAPRRAAEDDPDLVDRVDEGGGAAVEDRNLDAVDLDEDVVDAGAVEGRHQVFDGGDRSGFAFADDGAELGGGDGDVAGVDEAVTAAGKSGSKKDDAVVRFGGVENQSDVVARMNAAARQGYRSAERRLLVLSHSLNLGRASVHVTYRQRRESSGPAV
jgi:hypothetical protein